MVKPNLCKGTVKLTIATLACSLLPVVTAAQSFPVTGQQRATASAVASAGVALSDLKADAPASHTVVPGDTLWAISGLFLKSPWRWPELWGMNMAEIKNPHLIYPGQVLRLTFANGRAMLQIDGSDAAAADLPTVRLSPHTRVEALARSALPTLNNRLIEPFLAEPVIVDEAGLNAAPRIVATQDNRVLLTRGDRAYARSQSGQGLIDDPKQKQQLFRVFRNAEPLKDPVTGAVLGYEAQYIGKALLARSESTQEVIDKDGKSRTDVVPATIDLVAAKEEMRVGDRLLPEPPPELLSYVPHAPQSAIDARIVSVYGSAVVNAAQSQVVVVNKGSGDGIERGQVFAILKDGAQLVDKTDPTRPQMKLPDERNGLLMVFRTFDKLSYALILEITSGVKIGDRLASPL